MQPVEGAPSCLDGATNKIPGIIPSMIPSTGADLKGGFCLFALGIALYMRFRVKFITRYDNDNSAASIDSRTVRVRERRDLVRMFVAAVSRRLYTRFCIALPYCLSVHRSVSIYTVSRTRSWKRKEVS